MPTRKTILLLLRYNMYTRRKKQQLSHELSRFGQFIAMQKSRQGLDLHRSKKNFREALGRYSLESYIDSFDTFHDELFGRFYEDSQELEQPVQWSKDIHDLLDDCREFQSLQRTVDNDPELSALSASFITRHFEDEILHLLYTKNEQAQENRRQNDHDGGDRPTSPKDIKFEDLNQDAQDSVKGSMLSASIQMRENVQKIKEVKESLNTLGIPCENESNHERGEFIRHALNSSTINKLANMVGRLKRQMVSVPTLVKNKRQRKTFELQQGQLPDEIMRERFLACNDDTWDQYCYRAVTQKQWVRKKDGKDKMGRGPIIMCLDNSGSMSGPKFDYAKTIALALLSIAKEQKRKYELIVFGSNIRSHLILDSSNYMNLIDTIMGLTAFGGTDFYRPIFAACNRVLSIKNADIVFLTDGNGRVGEQTCSTVIKMTENYGMKFLTIYLDTTNSDELDQISSGTISIDDLTNDSGSVASLLKTVKR